MLRLRQEIKELKWRYKLVSFEEFLEIFSVWLRLNLVWQTVPGHRAGITEGSFTKIGFQRWLPVQEVTGRPEARPRWRCGSEFNHLGHVGRSLVGVNMVQQEAQFVENLWFIGSQCKRIRTGVMWSLDLVSVMRRAAAFCTLCNCLMVDSGKACEYSVAVVQFAKQKCRDQTFGDFFTSRVTDLTQSPQLKEATSDNMTDVLLHRLLIVQVYAKISYNRDRLDDVNSDWKCQVSRRRLAQISSTAEPLQLRFQRIQPISNVSYAAAQLMTDALNFRDLTRSVELFVVGEQVMADKIACEHIYEVLAVGMNSSGPRTEPWRTLQSTSINSDWTPLTEKDCDQFVR